MDEKRGQSTQLRKMTSEVSLVMEKLVCFDINLEPYIIVLKQLAQFLATDEKKELDWYSLYLDTVWKLMEKNSNYVQERTMLLQEITNWLEESNDISVDDERQQGIYQRFLPLFTVLQKMALQTENIFQIVVKATDIGENELGAVDYYAWDELLMKSRKQEIKEIKDDIAEYLESISSYELQAK